MRTAITLLVITSLLACGFVAAAQEEAAPGAPTDPSVEAAPGQETVEGAPGTETAPADGPREGDCLPDGRVVGTPRGERPVKQEDLDQGDGNVNPPNPPAQPEIVERVVERRTVVVRQLAAASQRGDQAAVRRLQTELGQLNERIAAVEANPLGGETGQRSMWGLLHDAGVRSESYLREHYGLQPVSAPENAVTTPAPVPAAPQGQGGRNKMTGTEWLILALIIGAAATAIAYALRGTRLDVLAGALGDAANRAQNNERLTFSAGPGRMRLTVEPANATPVLPPAPAPAPAQPAFPAAPLGVAYVPVQVTANPVTLNPAAPAQPAPAPAPAQPAPQPVQVWFNNNLQGQQPAPQQRQPQAQTPQGQQPAQRQPRNPRPNQGPAPAPAAGQGNPPAQGGGQGGNAPATP